MELLITLFNIIISYQQEHRRQLFWYKLKPVCDHVESLWWIEEYIGCWKIEDSLLLQVSCPLRTLATNSITFTLSTAVLNSAVVLNPNYWRRFLRHDVLHRHGLCLPYILSKYYILRLLIVFSTPVALFNHFSTSEFAILSVQEIFQHSAIWAHLERFQWFTHCFGEGPRLHPIYT